MKRKTFPINHDKCESIARVCACFNLRKATRAVTQIFDENLKPAGLRGTQGTLLTALYLAGPIAISRLAKILVMDRTTLTRNLRPLEKKGFVKLSSGRDQRASYISLTPRGEEVLAKQIPLWQKAQDQIVKVLGEDRWTNFLADLSRIVELSQHS